MKPNEKNFPLKVLYLDGSCSDDKLFQTRLPTGIMIENTLWAFPNMLTLVSVNDFTKSTDMVKSVAFFPHFEKGRLPTSTQVLKLMKHRNEYNEISEYFHRGHLEKIDDLLIKHTRWWSSGVLVYDMIKGKKKQCKNQFAKVLPVINFR